MCALCVAPFRIPNHRLKNSYGIFIVRFFARWVFFSFVHFERLAFTNHSNYLVCINISVLFAGTRKSSCRMSAIWYLLRIVRIKIIKTDAIGPVCICGAADVFHNFWSAHSIPMRFILYRPTYSNALSLFRSFSYFDRTFEYGAHIFTMRLIQFKSINKISFFFFSTHSRFPHIATLFLL